MPFYSQAHLAGAGRGLRATNLSLGHHPKTGDELLIPDKDRTMGMHVIGKAGSGKSSYIKNMVYQDALAKRGVILLDPHADLADECMAELPQASVADAFVLDMRDEAFPFGVNLFDMAGKLTTEEERTQAVDRILHIFDVLWPEVLQQQHLPMMLRCAIIAFLDNPGSTLVDMLDFFRDDSFRAHILSHVRDKTVREFFEYEHDQHSADERRRRVQPLMNRLQSLFVGRALPRNILGQRANSLNFRKAIEEHQLIFIKLPTTTMEQDARLVGTILMAQISAAIFSFVDLPPEKRPGVSLYVDEFQNFATPDIRRLVTEGRKYGVRLTVAHQFLAQLPKYLQDSVAGVHTKVVFRTNADDAKTLAAVFPPRAQSGATNDVDAHASKYLLEYTPNQPLVKTFVETYLRPLQSQVHGGRHAGKVEVLSERHIGVLDMLMPGAVDSNGKKAEFYVPDPTLYLDNLFVSVMQTKNAMLPIPWEAIVGFSNCNGGFFKAARWAKGTPDLTGNVQFPEYLANQTARGYVWLRQPENEREAFLHCIFHLRMVMMYLAQNPILKGGKAPTIDFAQMLIQLPIRMALVRSGEEAGQIVTNDTPTPLVGEALEARRFFIREHTRQRYCHPRGQIETLIESTTPPDEFTLGRWEAVESEDGTSNRAAIQSHTDLRHPAAGNSTGSGGTVSATTADSGATHELTLQPRLDQNDQGAAEDPYDVWVRAIRRDPNS